MSSAPPRRPSNPARLKQDRTRTRRRSGRCPSRCSRHTREMCAPAQRASPATPGALGGRPSPSSHRRRCRLHAGTRTRTAPRARPRAPPAAGPSAPRRRPSASPPCSAPASARARARAARGASAAATAAALTPEAGPWLESTPAGRARPPPAGPLWQGAPPPFPRAPCPLSTALLPRAPPRSRFETPGNAARRRPASCSGNVS